MGTHIQDTKRVLRREVQERLKAMTGAEQAAASAQARGLLEQQAIWRQAQRILFFAPMPGELDVWPLAGKALAAGKTVALPRFVAERNSYVACQVENLADEVKTGHFGIREPADRCAELALAGLDFVLVPGAAFDLHGRRLGRGKGYYDQLLVAVRGTTCGVAFDEQIVREVPVEPHDVQLDCVLTPTRWAEVTVRGNSQAGLKSKA